MKLILSLSVLAVALLMVLEGPAPAQADSSLKEDLVAFGDKVVEKVRDTFRRIDWKVILEPFNKVKDSIKRTFS